MLREERVSRGSSCSNRNGSKEASAAERKLAGENVRRLTLKESTAGQLRRDAKLYEFDADTSKFHRMLTGRELMAETN